MIVDKDRQTAVGRAGRELESFTLVDIDSTLQLVADQFTDMGRRVSYVRPDHAMAIARPDELRRGVTNLVENAVRLVADVTHLKLGRERLVASAGVFQEGNRLEAVVASVAVPEIDGAVRFFFDPVGDGDWFAALGARILLGQVTKA